MTDRRDQTVTTTGRELEHWTRDRARGRPALAIEPSDRPRRTEGGRRQGRGRFFSSGSLAPLVVSVETMRARIVLAKSPTRRGQGSTAPQAASGVTSKSGGDKGRSLTVHQYLPRRDIGSRARHSAV